MSSNTASVEREILAEYLLNPASLRTIMPLAEFRELFPPSHQEHPEIAQLYADLQFVRGVDTDLVAQNIDAEVRDGERQRRALWKGLHQKSQSQKPNGVNSEADRERLADDTLHGSTGYVSNRKPMHTQQSLLKEMEEVSQYLEIDALVARRDADKVLARLQETVGGLSDLRYGTFGRPGSGSGGTEDEVVKSLKQLEAAVSSTDNAPP